MKIESTTQFLTSMSNMAMVGVEDYASYIAYVNYSWSYFRFKLKN